MPATTTLVLLAVPVLVLLGALWVLQRRWGLDSIGQAATESLSRLLPTPIRTRSSLRRRFVRALTSQRVLMPSGQVVAATSLHLRIAPEDVARLAPDEDLDALATDAATLYARHAQRESWLLPAAPRVSIEVDPVLRSGWIPLAQLNRAGAGEADGTGVAPAPRRDSPQVQEAQRAPRLGPPADSTRAIPVQPAPDTTSLVAVPPGATVLTATRTPTLVLTGREDASVHEVRAPHGVLGRAEQCTVRIDEPSVSRRHARVEHRDGGWWVSDLGSSNGTYVGRQALGHGEQRELQPDDELRLGPDSPVLVVTMRS